MSQSVLRCLEFTSFFNSHLQNSSNGSLLLRLSKTYRDPSWKTLVYPSRCSAICDIGYARKCKEDFL